MADKKSILSIVDASIDQKQFLSHHWEGTFGDYLELVSQNPTVARNAFQRMYDMILHFGFERYTHLKQDYVRYHFFSDPIENGKDAIFGLDAPLMQLVDFFKSAAHGYGTDRCPMHEEPLKLIPVEARAAVLKSLNMDAAEGREVRIEGDLDPFCRKIL
jgi:predicted Ser/Thr protein kinase